ncbi:MAG TPA: hypothetical protein VE172_00955 [Stackebrandtia sp.]|jgi:hypothetical protein|uniref:hypothetical protein n=1 Tax=Stackebrandtia sp. TaxID=2023065 RepID=UPI002D2D2352|nr:hypothetical protein [Stackebrandtia sp.]HZE37359.1 hypothetical protein [Stackebrandtia sp.]
MGDLEDLDTVLKRVQGDDFAGSIIDPKIDKIKSTLDNAGVADWVPDEVEGYRQLLKDLSSVNPSGFNTSITSFRAAALAVGSDGDKPTKKDGPDVNPADTVSANAARAHQTVSGDGSNDNPPWRGDSADAFGKFIAYYTGGGQAVTSQAWMFNALELLALSHQAVYTRVRDDVTKYLDAVQKAADQNDGLFSSPDGSEQFFVTVIAAVATVAATAIAPPAGVPVALSLVGATASQTASVLGSVPKGSPEQHDINANSPGAIIDSMYTAYTKMQSGRDDNLKKIKGVLSDMSTYIGNTDTRKKIVGPEVNGGKVPIGGDGTIDPNYRKQFQPPVNA